MASSSGLVFLFDDTDSDFTYTGNWVTGGRPQLEYDSTTHGTNEAGASASFTFLGTSISVYGTIAANAKRAISTYTVDGSYSGTFLAKPTQDVQYRQLFYEVFDLPYGRHTIIITCNTENAQFWLDFVSVSMTAINEGTSSTSSILSSTTQPVTKSTSKVSTILSTTIPTSSSPSIHSIATWPASTVTSFAGVATTDTSSPVPTPAPVTTSTTTTPTVSGIIVYDTDPSIIYNGIWLRMAGSRNGDDYTSHATQEEGATATLHFTGTGVAIYGETPMSTSSSSRPRVPRVSTYTLDGGSPVIYASFSSDIPLLGEKRLFYQSHTLHDGNHTIIVTVGAGDLDFNLEYFVINSTSSFQPAPPLFSLVSSSPSSSASSGNHTPSDVSSQQIPASPGNHAGAIAGGVIAALVCIALALAAILWHRRRRAMRAPSRQAPKTPDPRWFTGHLLRRPTEKAQANPYNPVI